MQADTKLQRAGARPKVVIAGARFAGLRTDQSLARVPVDDGEIDRRDYHSFQPLLHQKVGPDLTVTGWPEIFAIGDTAAKRTGQYVGKVIAARVAGDEAPEPFKHCHHGDLATVGRQAAMGRLDRIHLKELIARLFWGWPMSIP